MLLVVLAGLTCDLVAVAQVQVREWHALERLDIAYESVGEVYV